jgi:hypothetical protein
MVLRINGVTLMMVRKNEDGMFEMTSKTIMTILAVFTVFNMLAAGLSSWVSTKNTVQNKLDAHVFAIAQVTDSSWKATHEFIQKTEIDRSHSIQEQLMLGQAQILQRITQMACKDQPASCR